MKKGFSAPEMVFFFIMVSMVIYILVNSIYAISSQGRVSLKSKIDAYSISGITLLLEECKTSGEKSLVTETLSLSSQMDVVVTKECSLVSNNIIKGYIKTCNTANSYCKTITGYIEDES